MPVLGCCFFYKRDSCEIPLFPLVVVSFSFHDMIWDVLIFKSLVRWLVYLLSNAADLACGHDGTLGTIMAA